MSLVKNLPTQWRETEEENRTKDQSMINLLTHWELKSKTNPRIEPLG